MSPDTGPLGSPFSVSTTEFPARAPQRLYLVERGIVSLETKRGEMISQEDVLEMYFGEVGAR